MCTGGRIARKADARAYGPTELIEANSGTDQDLKMKTRNGTIVTGSQEIVGPRIRAQENNLLLLLFVLPKIRKQLKS